MLRAKILSKSIYTDWKLLATIPNSILIDVTPKSLWTVPTLVNTTSSMLARYLPVKLVLHVNQFEPAQEKLY